MGYTEALLGRDYRRESEDLQKKSKKKSLWGSIGRTVGTLGAMAISGGTLNPVTLGLLSGGASFLVGAIGARAAGGKLTGGTFMQEERKSLQKELGAFGSQNITSSLKSGLQAGIGQATKLYGEGSRAKELGKSAEEVAKIRKGTSFGESFGESFVGKHGGTDVLHKMKQGKADLLYGGDRTTASKKVSKGLKNYEFVSDSPENITKGTFSGDDLYDWDDDMASSSWKSGGEQISAYDIEKNKMKALGEFVQDKDMMSQYGDQLYKEGAGFTGDDITQTRDVMAKYATPQEQGLAKTTVTNTYGNRDATNVGGEYFFEETKNKSLWDKTKDFIDVSDVEEKRAIESQLAQYRGNMSANVPNKSWQEQIGLGKGETELQKGFDQYKTFEVGEYPNYTRTNKWEIK